MHKMLDIARKILAEQLNIPLGIIAADTAFYELAAEPTDVAEIIMALEDIYDVDFPKDDLEYYPNLESLVECLYNYMQQVRK